MVPKHQVCYASLQARRVEEFVPRSPCDCHPLACRRVPVRPLAGEECGAQACRCCPLGHELRFLSAAVTQPVVNNESPGAMVRLPCPEARRKLISTAEGGGGNGPALGRELDWLAALPCAGEILGRLPQDGIAPPGSEQSQRRAVRAPRQSYRCLRSSGAGGVQRRSPLAHRPGKLLCSREMADLAPQEPSKVLGES